MSISDLPFGMNLIISAVAGLLYLAVLISIPFRIKKNGSGSRGKSFWLREIAIFVLSAVIIVLCAFISFGTVGNLVLCACGVLGSVIAARELTGSKDSSAE